MDAADERGHQPGPPRPTARPTRAVLAVLGSITSLQLGAATASRLFHRVGPVGATALRLGLSAGVLCLLERPRPRRWSAEQRRAVVVFGLTLATMNTAFYEAVARLPLGAAITIEFLGPLGLAAAHSRRLREAWPVALAVAGVGLLGAAEAGAGRGLDPVGVAAALVAGACWAAYILAGARVARGGPDRGGLAGAGVVAGVLAVPLGLASAGSALVAPRVLGLGLVVAVLASVVPYSLELRALRRLPPRTFSILVALEPAVGALVGAVALGDRLDPLALAGIALVVAAGVAATREVPPEPALAPVA